MRQTTKTWKRASAWLLTAAMVFSMQTLPAYATEETQTPPPVVEDTTVPMTGLTPSLPAGAEMMSLAAEEAYLPQSEMTANASSYPGYPTRGADAPEMAIDGAASPSSNPAVRTAWCVNWNDGSITSPQWFEVDLGKNYTVNAIEMAGRTNAATVGGFITKYDLLVKAEDAETYTTTTADGSFTPQINGTPVRAELPANTQARYVRLVAKEITPVPEGKFWPAISNFNVVVPKSELPTPEPEPEPDPEPDPDPAYGPWSDNWSTPEIAPKAAALPGVAEPVISLNTVAGLDWEFLFSAPAVRPEEEADLAANWDSGSSWDNIIVPGELVMQGHDIENEVEYYYQTQVEIPTDYAGKRVLLRFNGAYSYARVWVDGDYIRDHSGGFTSWDCDITGSAAAGTTVTVTVGITDKLNNPSIASWYAQHNIGGILRDVELLALDQNYIKRLYVETELDEMFENAELIITTELAKPEDKAAVLEILVADADGELMKNSFTIAAGTEIKTNTFAVTAPKLWDAEHPNLYTLTATLKIDEVVVQSNTQRIGFREITFGGADATNKNMVYVNGQQVKLRGTCRHDMSYDMGRSSTPEQDLAEIAAFKAMNINFIRTSHYPPTEAIIEACDELGIYVLEETAVCFQGQDNKPPRTTDADYLDQFTEMVERDRNHPSVLIWSLGNESWGAWTDAFQTEAEYIADVDTSRPTMFSYPWTSNAPVTDIYSTHYASYDGDYTTTPPYGGIPANLDRPLLHDEYTHVACYNTTEIMRDTNVRNFWGETLKRFWEYIFETDGELGGALWGGVDDVFYIPEGTTPRHQSYSKGSAVGYGEWGSVLDAYRRFKPEAYHVKKAYSPIRLEDGNVANPGNAPLVLELKNWFDHTNLNEVRLVYAINSEAAQTIAALDSLAPHNEGTLTLPARDWQAGDKINFKFYTAVGNLFVDESNVTIGETTVQFPVAGDTAPTFAEAGDIVTVTGTDFTVKFNRTTARLTEGAFLGDVLIADGPTLNVTGLSLGNWKPSEETPFEIRTEANKVIVTLRGSFGSQGVDFEIAISDNGRLETTYTLTTAPTKLSGFSEIGVSYLLGGDVESVDWLRDGLWSAYPEGHLGRTEGTALRVRPGSDVTPDVYGVKPDWAWEMDMRNFYLYKKDSIEDGLTTNDFRAMRENIHSYSANFEGLASKVQVESDGTEAARVAVGYSKPLTVDDGDTAAILYHGTGWGHDSGKDFYNDTQSYSNVAGDSCTFTFEGSGIRFIGSRQNNTGKVIVTLDSDAPVTIDTYNGIGGAMKQSVIFTKEGLSAGPHTIKLEVVGGTGNSGFVLVDAFQVLTGEATKLESTLIINKEWNYPELDWKNYEKPALTLTNGSTGKVTLRLAETDLVRATGMTLDQESVELQHNVAENTAVLTATFAPAAATHRALSWTTSDESIATVKDGVVTAVAEGTAIITATAFDGGFTDTCTVKVSTYTAPYTPPSNTTTVTEKHEDGSTTKTVTDKKTGNVTETTTYPDGTKVVATTPKGGETTIEVTVPKNKDSVTVTIPTPEKPKAGEVAVIVNADGTKTVVKKSISTEEGMRITLAEGAKLEIIDNSKTFEDVAGSEWYADAVTFVTSRELFQGGSGNRFEAGVPMNRAMLMTVLYRYEGTIVESTGDAWYADAQQWATAAGITDGSSPEAEITREQLATILFRYAKGEATQADMSAFVDADGISDYAKDAMAWAVANNILQGSGNNLNPKHNATRGEVAIILQRFFELG